MKLCIKKILIEKNGKTAEAYNFTQRASVVCKSRYVYDIIKVLLGVCESKKAHRSIRFLAVVEFGCSYNISGKKGKDDLHFTLLVHRENEEKNCTDEYFNLISQAVENDGILFFHHFKKQDYPHRLCEYKDILINYPNSDFARLTNGYGTTRSFRGFIADYIKHFKPIKLYEHKELYLMLSKNGEFQVGYLNSDKTVCLSDSEELLYHYLSFLCIADFWDRAERIRNLHRVNKPLVITFKKDLKERDLLSKITDCVCRTDRQVMFISIGG